MLDVNFLHKSTYIHFNHFFSNISIFSSSSIHSSVIQVCDAELLFNILLYSRSFTAGEAEIVAESSNPLCFNEGGVI